MGLLAKSTNGFGMLRVNGLNRVPKPPTRISAFMVIIQFKLAFPCMVNTMSIRVLPLYELLIANRNQLPSDL